LDPRDRAYDCKERGAIVKRSKPGWERRSLSTWSTHFNSCPAVEAVAGSFTVEAGGQMELIRSTAEMGPSLESKSYHPLYHWRGRGFLASYRRFIERWFDVVMQRLTGSALSLMVFDIAGSPLIS